MTPRRFIVEVFLSSIAPIRSSSALVLSSTNINRDRISIHQAPVAALRVYVKTGSLYEGEYLGAVTNIRDVIPFPRTPGNLSF